MANLTINGNIPLAANIDATVLHVLSPNFEDRLHWTHFVGTNSSGGGSPIDIDVRGGAVALTMTTNAAMVTVNAIAGTSGTQNNTSPAIGYLVVIPTAPAPSE